MLRLQARGGAEAGGGAGCGPGKCNINAAPNETVAQEIAAVVSEILLDAFGQVTNPPPPARARAAAAAAALQMRRGDMTPLRE